MSRPWPARDSTRLKTSSNFPARSRCLHVRQIEGAGQGDALVAQFRQGLAYRFHLEKDVAGIGGVGLADRVMDDGDVH